MFTFSRSRRRRRLGLAAFRRLNLQSLRDPVVISKLVKLAFLGFVAAVLFIPMLFLWYSRDLPTPGKLVEAQMADSTRIYDRKGVLLYSVYEEQNRTYVALDAIPKNLRNGTIAIEDKDFYTNKGFSVIGIIRGTLGNLIRGRRAAGGSTITQQLVKNVLLTDERSLPRKIKELILAIQVDERFTKDEILEMYLNNISYGGTAIGVEAAAETYFGKKAKELDLAESAFLAGLPQSPSIYSPFTGNTYYVGRTEAVLRRMVEDKHITKEQSEKALKKIKEYKFSQRGGSIKAPHFVMYVKEQLARQFGENGSQLVEKGGLQVTTTLDYELQQKAEAIMKEEIDTLETYKVGNGGAIVSDPKTGEILSMVGSKDYFGESLPAGCISGKSCVFEPNLNVTLANRQPGSSLKPVIYAKAFEKGYAPATMLMDVKTNFPSGDPTNPNYAPGNYSGKFQGPVQVRFALANSLNIPAVKMLALVGIKDAMQKAYDMGIENWQPTDEAMQSVGLALVLGGRETTLLDEVTAYGVFANKGVRQDPVSILKVTDNKGKKLFEHKQKQGPRALSEEVAFLISHILLDNVARTQEFGANSLLRVPGKTVSVKTGTTDEKRDNWTIGYTPSFVIGVWVGNNDNSQMNQKIASGVTGASSIWHELMVLALKDKPNEEFAVPSNVTAIQVDSLGGGLPVAEQPSRTEYFIKGTEPTTKSPIYQDSYLVFRENDPLSSDGKNRWQEGIDAWIEQYHKDEQIYHPPGNITDKRKEEEKKEEPTATPAPDQPTATPSPTYTPTPTPTP